jgi:hypothetical protein
MRRARLEEAEAFVKESQRAAGSEDIFSQVLLRSVWSKVTAREGRPD